MLAALAGATTLRLRPSAATLVATTMHLRSRSGLRTRRLLARSFLPRRHLHLRPRLPTTTVEALATVEVLLRL
jgi:hypothetical protein